jgi:predicted nucleotidyltransferase
MSLIDHRKIIESIVKAIETEESVQGVFLSGSLIDENQDEFSDIGLGIASINSQEALEKSYSLRHAIMEAVGKPIDSLERGWENCKMIAALYGRSQFPPLGLEVDVIFSQLRHVSEQMPYADYEVVFDRSGTLRQALAKLSRRKPKEEVQKEIRLHLAWCPFYVHDALKACERGDSPPFHTLLDEIRKQVFFAAAASRGQQVCGSKRGLRYLSASERLAFESSYHGFNKGTVQKLTDLYVAKLKELEVRYQLGPDVEQFQRTLKELL